jgi:hypothetical protein
MKNLKQITFGLLLSALVIGFSAFTNNHADKAVRFHRADGSFLSGSIVQTVANTTFKQSAAPSGDNCNTASTDYNCIYTVTTAGASNIPNQASYSSSEIDDYVSESPAWLVPSGSSKAVYTAAP